MNPTLLLGDCAEQMRTLADNSVDAIVTDPPYGLAFMGANWDYGVPGEMYWREALRVAKPGAHLLAFGGTRTYHRLACAIEDAGWEIRDCIMWVYGCLSEDTEILTCKGWAKIGTIQIGDRIHAYDRATKTFRYEEVKDTFLYDYDDTAYRIQSDCTDQLVSRNHRVIVERGGVEVFEYAENLAQEQEARVPVLESLQNLLDHISMLDKRAGSSEQNVLAGMCGGVGAENAKATLGRPFTDQDLPHLRKGILQASRMAEKGEDKLLLCKLQEQGRVRPSADEIQQRTPNSDNGGAETDFKNKDDRRSESSMERRGDIPTPQGKLCECSVCALPEEISANGSEGRICNGTSSCGCESDWSAPGANGSCASYQSQSVRQSSGESNALSKQFPSQIFRDAWRTTTTLARITPVHYKGRMWCVSVPSGAIVARRNGKMFVTGNSGFPKSMDVAKAIDKASGYKGEVIGSRIVDVGMQGGNMHAGRKQQQQQQQIRALSPEAAVWQGWGTCLKPAVEPIVVARKPLEGTVAANCLKYGTGALNIDGCRVPLAADDKLQDGVHHNNPVLNTQNEKWGFKNVDRAPGLGRFPANLIHDGSPEVLALFPESKGQCGAVKGNEPSEITRGIYGKFSGDRPPCSPRNDSGSAARFFNSFRDGEASADRRYTAEGSTNFAMKPGMRRPAEDTPARFFYCAKASRSERGSFNDHCTVKPLALMRHLVRLVTRKGGIVLDPFMGSGTTGVAAIEEGMNFIGIERDTHYYEIASRRITEAKPIPPTTTQQELPLCE